MVFDHISIKHLKVVQTNSTRRLIFISLLGVRKCHGGQTKQQVGQLGNIVY